MRGPRPEEKRRLVRKHLELGLMTAATAAALPVITAGLALEQDDRPESIRCNEQSADKGAICIHEENDTGANQAERSFNLCPLLPPGMARETV